MTERPPGAQPGAPPPRPGDVVGWIDRGEPVWGHVLAVDARIRVAGPRGEHRLRPTDLAVVLAGEPTPPEEIRERTAAAASQLDPERLWRELRRLGSEWLTPQEAGARLELDPGAVWLAMWHHPEYFAREGRTRFRLRAPEEVAAARAAAEQRRRVQERIELATTALTHTDGLDELAARVQAQNDLQRFLAEALGESEPELPQLLRDELHRQLQRRYDALGGRWPWSWFLARIAGATDPWFAGDPVVNRHRQWLRAAAGRYTAVARGPELEPAAPLVAVDEPEVADRDDALGIRPTARGLRIEVALADPTETLLAQPELLEPLVQMGSTLYLPTGTIPLLPEPLTRAHSLDPGTVRPVWLLAFEVDRETGVPLAPPTLRRGLVPIAAAATYGELDADPGRIPYWEALQRVGERWFAVRRAAGATAEFEAEVSVEVRGGHPVGLRRYTADRGARLVVRELMIEANRLAAELLAEAGAIAPFRVQEPGGPTLLAPRPGRHATLGVPAYLYVTSPIRRTVDLLAQLVLRRDDRGVPTPEELYALARRAEEAAAARKRWMAAADRYWKLRYLEAFPSTELEGRILAWEEEAVRVRVEPLGLTLRLPPPPSRSDRAPLEIVELDAERGQLELAWRRGA